MLLCHLLPLLRFQACRETVCLKCDSATGASIPCEVLLLPRCPPPPSSSPRILPEFSFFVGNSSQTEWVISSVMYVTHLYTGIYIASRRVPSTQTNTCCTNQWSLLLHYSLLLLFLSSHSSLRAGILLPVTYIVFDNNIQKCLKDRHTGLSIEHFRDLGQFSWHHSHLY